VLQVIVVQVLGTRVGGGIIGLKLLGDAGFGNFLAEFQRDFLIGARVFLAWYQTGRVPWRVG